MLRRTITLGVTVLTLVAAPVFSAEAEKKSASKTADKASVPTFTNADIEALPSDGNSNLPSLEDDANAQGANRFVIIGTPAPEGSAASPQPAADPETA